MPKWSKTALKVTGIALGAVLVLVLAYLAYLLIDYSRIEDCQPQEVLPHGIDEPVRLGQSYTIVSQNIGFGAYTPEFTFFMDGGKQSWAESPESVRHCIDQAAVTLSTFQPDFLLIQEVDIDATRSYHIDQKEILLSKFPDYSATFALNYHSSFLMYPFTEPHGASNAGILTLSKYNMTSSLRRSLPISTGVSKFLDLDRCYSVSRIPVENGKELVIYNVHMSAYGGSPEIREAQMKMLFADMVAEYEKGNYCVCGGDFNHDFTGDSQKQLNQNAPEDFGWTQPFPISMLPDCIKRCIDYENGLFPTCRNCDEPYKEGNYTIIVDGFLVTENVEVVAVSNVHTGFAYSDHNPVVLTFKLK
ncbi:MAG: endonuclease/exonuclease/phosphatase family protein [Clostridia bacterium]|nr:endonuclease/exonuclease/phosphatase family protein [Clostridia bacterium]